MTWRQNEKSGAVQAPGFSNQSSGLGGVMQSVPHSQESVNLQAAALAYIGAGLSVVPVNADKKPVVSWKPYQERLPTVDEVRAWRGSGVALVCGAVSGGLECLDFDLRGPGDLTFSSWCDDLEVARPGLFNVLCVQSTPSGGRHVVYRHDGELQGNTELAHFHGAHRRTGEVGWHALIETRGQGGYFVVAPSPGWSILQGDLLSLPVLSEDDRALLLDLARAYDERDIIPQQQQVRTAAAPAVVVVGDGDRERVALALASLAAVRCDSYKKWVGIGQALHHWDSSPAGLALWEGWSRQSSKFHDGDCSVKWAGFGTPNGKQPVTVASIFDAADTDKPGWWRGLPKYQNGHASRPVPEPPEWLDQDHGVVVFDGDQGQPLTGSSEAPPALGADSVPDLPPPSFNRTDLGNAKRLVFRHGAAVRWVPGWGSWVTWDGMRWRVDDTGVVQRCARDTVRAMYGEAATIEDVTERKNHVTWARGSENRSRLSAMVELAQAESGAYVSHETLDSNHWLLNVQNGIVDLRTGELLPHDRGLFCTKLAPVVYDPQARCDLWLQFLHRIFNGDESVIEFVRRGIGYSLAGDVSEQCLFFAYGKGKNGKSTTFEVLRCLLGDYFQKAPTSMLMLKQGDTIPNDVARLPGARFVVAAELEEGKRLAESLVKDLTGGDRLVARFLNKEFFEFQPSHKLWMFGNHKPVVRGTDDAIWRRIHLIPFTVTIPEDERDPHMADKLKAELPGILAWAIQGCLDWQGFGLGVPAVVRDATSDYRREQDVLLAFIAELCVTDGTASATVKELYLAYLDWCKESSEHAISKRQFNDRLRERGYTTAVGHANVWRWEKLGLPAPMFDKKAG